MFSLCFDDLLTDEGYKTTRVFMERNLPEIAALDPDLIILDYQWASDDDGWSLLQMLRMNPPTAKIPIILCTGAVRHVLDTESHLEEMGIRTVFKPFELDTLLSMVAEALEHRRSGLDGK